MSKDITNIKNTIHGHECGQLWLTRPTNVDIYTHPKAFNLAGYTVRELTIALLIISIYKINISKFLFPYNVVHDLP